MTIAEVSKKYDLTPDTLRYYERVGLIPAVKRTGGGIRNYDEEACRWVEFVKCMRAAGLPVEVLIKYVALSQQGEQTAEARKNLLLEQREILKSRIEELNRTLERLDYKIRNYDRLSACLRRGEE